MKRDFPELKDAVEYNGAFQPSDFIFSQKKDIKRLYTSDDGLYKLGGKLFRNNTVIAPTKSTGVNVIDAVSGHVLSNFKKLYPSSTQADLEGSGLFDIVAPISDLFVRKKHPKSSREFLSKFGNEQITSIEVSRTPVPERIEKVFNVLSVGGWNKAKKDYKYERRPLLVCQRELRRLCTQGLRLEVLVVLVDERAIERCVLVVLELTQLVQLGQQFVARLFPVSLRGTIRGLRVVALNEYSVCLPSDARNRGSP